MSTLNVAWMVNVLAQAIEATASGSYVPVGDHAEIHAMRDAGFIKFDKRKKDENNSWMATAAEGVTVTQLEQHFTAQDTAPQIQTEAAAIPAAPAFEAPALEQTAAPQFTAEQAPAAPVVHGEFVGQQLEAPVVVDTVTIGDNAIEIESGIAYVKHVPVGLRNVAPRSEKYPFEQLATLKQQSTDVNFVPSFHIANMQTKNFSNTVTRANEKYEASHGVTFRAQRAPANDPKGEGVRVFAMSLDQAPARQSRKKKEVAAPVA